LESLFISGDFLPGDQLPSERSLAENYRVGRPLIREALGLLRERGLVISLPGRGNFVKERQLTDFGGSVDFATKQGRVTPRHLIAARSMLEGEAAALAARMRSEVDLQEMWLLVEKMESAEHLNDVIDADASFHEAVAIASANPVVQIMFGSIRNLIHGLVARSVLDKAVRSVALPSHRLILNAIEAGKSSEARDAMLDHLSIAGGLYGADLDRPLKDIVESRHLFEK